MKKIALPLMILTFTLLLSSCALNEPELENNDQNIPEVNITPEPTESSEITERSEAEGVSEVIEPTASLPEPTPTVEMVVDGPCNHPLFPIFDGASWHYEDNLDGGYIVVLEETGQDSFMMTQEVINDGLTITVTWYCIEGGLLSGSVFDLDMLGSGDPGTSMIIHNIDMEGQTLPSYELMALGYGWQSTYNLAADLVIGGETIEADLLISMDHVMAAIEPITVPAGTFPEAHRIDTTAKAEIRVFMNGIPTTLNETDFTRSNWYAEGVGMIKGEYYEGGLSSIEELISFSFLD